jgi:tetratricopeptide (TPR) repeat protein
VRALLLGLALLVVGCHPPAASLADGQRAFSEGRWSTALADFDRVAARTADPAERARALTGAALACEKLGRVDEAQRRLERAIDPEVPGASEVALFQLAELLRTRDRARALNLYYRAAAAAEHNLHGAFPYHAATERLLQLSLSR